jgi:aldehyde dehydrogenase (NAD+)
VERLSALIDRNKIVCGGEVDIDNRYIAPTVLRDVDLDDPVMREEVFGPILPVLKIGTLADVHRYIDANPDPLSLYLFSSDEEDERYVVERIRFGGGCINNTLVHFVDPTMPFGGVGRSGYGRSHGEAAFNTFSVSKSINRAGTFVDPPMRYAPYAGKLPVLRRLLR